MRVKTHPIPRLLTKLERKWKMENNKEIAWPDFPESWIILESRDYLSPYHEDGDEEIVVSRAVRFVDINAGKVFVGRSDLQVCDLNEGDLSELWVAFEYACREPLTFEEFERVYEEIQKKKLEEAQDSWA